MSERFERFLDRFTKPFAQNHELDLLVKGELRTKEEEGKFKDDCFKEAERQLVKVDESVFRRRWRIGLAILAVLSMAICLAIQIPKLIALKPAIGYVSGGNIEPSYQPAELARNYAKRIPAQDAWLLFGDTSKRFRSERIKALWEQDRSNPVFYKEYALAYLEEKRTLPPDFLQQAEAIDPGNGWFPYFAAACRGRDGVIGTPSPSQNENDGALNWTIKDKTGFARSMELFRQGMTMPRFESYEEPRRKQRFSLLHHWDDVVGWCEAFRVVEEDPSALRGQNLMVLVAAQAEQYTKEKDAAGFQQLLKDWKSFLGKVSREPSNGAYGCSLKNAIAGYPALNLRDGAVAFGMPEEAEKFSRLHQGIKEEFERQRNGDKAMDDLVSRKGSLYAKWMLPIISQYSGSEMGVNEAMLAPGRNTDHAIAGRIGTVCLGLLLLLIILAVSLHRFRYGRLCSLVAHRATDLLKPVDWWWIVLLGGCAPLVIFFLIHYGTPFGARSQAASGRYPWLNLMPYLALLGWIMVAPVLVSRWRLRKRAGFLSFRFPSAWFGVLSLLLGLIVIVVMGAEPIRLWTKVVTLILLIALVVLQHFWWISLLLCGLVGNSARAVPRQMVAYAILPAYFTALLLLSLLPPLFYAEERHWVIRDPLILMEPEYNGMGRIEGEAVKAANERIRALLAPLEK